MATQEEEARYLKTLEELVKAGVVQLNEAIMRTAELLRALKRIQTIENVAEMRQAIQVAIEVASPHTPVN